MITPKCSFIVSAYNRPDHLAVCLGSLKIQTEPDFEVLVTDNAAPDAPAARDNRIVVVSGMQDPRFTYDQVSLVDCYESANWGAAVAAGEYLCFPSDDGWYAPRFLELMLRNGEGADLIYCNCIWDGRGYGRGEECIHLVTAPVTGKIDKGGFLIRRSAFPGFPGILGGKIDRCADGWMIEDAVRRGATVKKVDMTGWAHS